MFEPLLATERIADRGFESSGELDDFVVGVAAAFASEDRYGFGVVDHLRELIEVCVGGAQDRCGWNRDLGGLAGYICRGDVAGHRNYGGAFFEDGGEDCSIDDGAGLFGIDEARGVEGCGVEELVGVELFRARMCR